MKRIAWVDIVQTIFPSIKEFAFVRMKFNPYRVFCHHKSLFEKMYHSNAIHLFCTFRKSLSGEFDTDFHFAFSSPGRRIGQLGGVRQAVRGRQRSARDKGQSGTHGNAPGGGPEPRQHPQLHLHPAGGPQRAGHVWKHATALGRRKRFAGCVGISAENVSVDFALKAYF